jgi:hypothetical protein
MEVLLVIKKMMESMLIQNTVETYMEETVLNGARSTRMVRLLKMTSINGETNIMIDGMVNGTIGKVAKTET